MSQSMRGSLAETLFNTIVGFTINYSANVLVMPRLWSNNHIARAAFYIGVIFTVISVVRGLLVRRLFNRPDFAAWIDRMNNHLEVPAEWLKTRLASVTSRVRSAARKTISRATMTGTRTASPPTAITANPPPDLPHAPQGVEPGEASRAWT